MLVGLRSTHDLKLPLLAAAFTFTVTVPFFFFLRLFSVSLEVDSFHHITAVTPQKSKS
jgi:hypothetical protein